MRKHIKRSLIVWPLAASSIISVTGGLASVLESRGLSTLDSLARQFRRTASPALAFDRFPIDPADLQLEPRVVDAVANPMPPARFSDPRGTAWRVSGEHSKTGHPKPRSEDRFVADAVDTAAWLPKSNWDWILSRSMATPTTYPPLELPPKPAAEDFSQAAVSIVDERPTAEPVQASDSSLDAGSPVVSVTLQPPKVETASDNFVKLPSWRWEGWCLLRPTEADETRFAKHDSRLPMAALEIAETDVPSTATDVSEQPLFSHSSPDLLLRSLDGPVRMASRRRTSFQPPIPEPPLPETTEAAVGIEDRVEADETIDRAERPIDARTSEDSTDGAADQASVSTPIRWTFVRAPRRDVDHRWSAWSRPISMQREMANLQLIGSAPAKDAWKTSVEQHLETLATSTSLADPTAAPAVDALSELADQALAFGESASEREQQIQWLALGHSLRRRADVWDRVHRVAAGHRIGPDAAVVDHPPRSLSDAIAAVRSRLEETGDVANWQRYLLLDEIDAAIADPSVNRLTLAQRTLGRLRYHGISIDAREFLDHATMRQFAEALRPWSGGAVNYVAMLRQIERLESDPNHLASMEIAEAIETLRHSDSPAARSVAETLSTHYRNANVRLVASETLLKRLLPAIDPRSVPVSTTLLGSRVRGQSQIVGKLGLDIQPHADGWKIQLRTTGDVVTRSVGTKSGVQVHTRSDNRFVADKPILIAATGLQSEPAHVDVRGRTVLQNIQTPYQGWPLVGTLIESVAQRQFDASKRRAEAIGNRRIRAEVRQEIDQRFSEQSLAAEEQLTDMLLGPMGRLRLDPTVVDLHSSDSRLAVRYRVAGDWQLAAFTPRPRAPKNSLMSLQVHQSTMNNLLSQVIPRFDSMELSQVMQRAAGAMNQSVDVPEDLPDGVEVQFAETRPMTIEIDDGRLWMTLRVRSLSRDGGRPLTNFIVRAAYRAETNGLRARLVRDGHLSISGPGMAMRERLPLRVIFNKVLSENRPIEVTLPKLNDHPAAEGLAISQLELRDGWIALAISEADQPRIALR